MTTAKRRPRRVASDEAHAWARSLELNNSGAKSVLRALAFYVNAEGCCFVGIDELAGDTDLSPDTVRRRLVWLEEIGAIMRRAQWVDDKGRRNSDGRGKRTTDEIQLLINADQDAIEARARGEFVEETEAISTAISPSRQQGLNSPQPSVSPALALAVVQGADSLNHEPEDSPLPPLGGDDRAVASEDSGKSEPPHFAGFFEACQHWRAVPRSKRLLAAELFDALTQAEQLWAEAASPLHAAECEKAKRKSVDPQRLIADRFWLNYPHARPVEKPSGPAYRRIEGGELEGFLVALRIAGFGEPAAGRPVEILRLDVQHDLVALASHVTDAAADRERWQIVEVGSREFGAWRDRLELWFGKKPEAQRIKIEPYNAAVHGLPPNDPNFRFQKQVDGFRVPRPFPPRRDGSWADGSNGGDA